MQLSLEFCPPMGNGPVNLDNMRTGVSQLSFEQLLADKEEKTWMR